MVRSNEAGWWSLFSAGGVVAAFFFPAMMVVTGLAAPAGWISAEGLYALAQHPLARLFLFVLISLPLFHAAHRIRHVAADLGLAGLGPAPAIVSYGAAVLGTVSAALILVWR